MTKRTLSALLAATLGFGGSAFAADPAANPAELQRQLEQLQQQVRDLQAKQATPAAPVYTGAQVDATVSSLIKDADRRSALLAETGGFYGGWMDDKFTIRSADGDYDLSPGVQLQFRNITNFNENQGMNGGDEFQNGFDVRRLKFSIDGHAITKKLYYNFVWATARDGGGLFLEEAYAQYQFADNFSLKAGQYKEYIYHEQIVSSKRQLAVDRSLVNEVLNGGESYVQGVDLLWDGGRVRADIAITDGYNSRNTTWQDPPTNAFDFGVHSRVEFAAMGDFKGYNQFTSLGTKTDLLVLGAGADWSQNGDIDVYHGNVDAQWNSGPFGAYGAFVVLYNEPGNSGGQSSFDYGIVVQGSYLINSQWEAFARYDYMQLENAGRSAIGHGTEDTFHEVTVGVNYYLRGHQAKITLDAGWLPNGAPNNQEGAGILANDGTNEYYIRAQFQLLI
jgi:hypothetical protein